MVAVVKTKTMTEATLNRDLTHQHQDLLTHQLLKLPLEPTEPTHMRNVSL